MAIIENDINDIISAVIAAIRTNTKTIDQLSPVTSLSDSDCFEINGGKRVSYAVLRELLLSLTSEELDSLRSQAYKNALDSVSVTATESNVTLTVSTVGKTISTSVPLATPLEAGMMSASDKRELSTATNEIGIIKAEVSVLDTTMATLTQDLQQEIIEREEVEQSVAEIEERLSELEGFRVFSNDQWLLAVTAKAEGTEEEYVLFGIDREGRVSFDKGIPGEVQERFEELEGYQVMRDENYLFAITDNIGTLLLGIEKSGQVVIPLGQVRMMSREQYDAIDPRPDTLYVIKGRDGVSEGAYVNGQSLTAGGGECVGEAGNFFREENLIKYRGDMKHEPIIRIDHETMEAKVDYPSDYEGPMIVSDSETKTLFVI